MWGKIVNSGNEVHSSNASSSLFAGGLSCFLPSVLLILIPYQEILMNGNCRRLSNIISRKINI